MNKIIFKESGIIPIYKPSGPTSLDVIRELKQKYKFNKIGHLGTLDPMAEGILPIMINQATKLAPILDVSNKSYKTVIKFGIETDTNDITGKTINQKEDFSLTRKELEDSLLKFNGEIDQFPPKFAAVKINGVRAYKLAREGVEFETTSKKVSIHKIELKRFFLPYAEIEVECSRGTYIRSIIRDLGYALNIPATMSKLIRSSSSNFSIKQSVSLEDAINDLENKLIKLESIFDFHKININKFEYKLIQNGQIPSKLEFPDIGYSQLLFEGKLSAIIFKEDGESKLFKVFINN
jgi:tRNA pseudouridine55 synthase